MLLRMLSLEQVGRTMEGLVPGMFALKNEYRKIMSVGNKMYSRTFHIQR